MSFVDTHCHIQSDVFKSDPDQAITEAKAEGVGSIICVGEEIDDSKKAAVLAENHNGVYWTAGIHPHEADKQVGRLAELRELVVSTNAKMVGIGECGLDYWYLHSDKENQLKTLRFQLELAQEFELPLSLHIRGSKEDPDDAFRDFFKVFENFRGLNGVVHSFTSGQRHLDGVLSSGLLVGVNGIISFPRSVELRSVIAKVPADKYLLETDAPFLTPSPKRGKINIPSYIPIIAEHVAEVRNQTTEAIEAESTANANRLFSL